MTGNTIHGVGQFRVFRLDVNLLRGITGHTFVFRFVCMEQKWCTEFPYGVYKTVSGMRLNEDNPMETGGKD